MAQVAVNRNARYLFAADPGDARSNWVNPGGLGLAGTLSVYADFTLGLEPPYETGSPVSQISLGLNSHFIALAYQFDRLPDPLGAGTVRGHAVRVAIWGQDGRVGGGGSGTWYGGAGDGGVGFDFGVVYRATPFLDVGGVLVNVGQPAVRGTELRFRIRPAVTLHSANSAFALQGQGDIGTDRIFGFAVGARLGVRRPPLPLQIIARLDTDGAWRRESFSFGLSLGGESRTAAVVTASGDLRVPDAASLHFVSERSNPPARRGRR